jgi:signal transduction histidine kinase
MIGVRLPMHDRSGLWEALPRQEPVIIADIRDDSAAAHAFRRTVGTYYESRAMRDVRSFMAIPLVNRDHLVGLLTMSSRERDVFTEHHAGLALAIATHIAAALENARLYGEVRGKAALEERARLARELHDSVSQALYGIGLGAQTARKWLDRDPARAVQPVDYVLSLAAVGMAEMRALLFELRPEALAEEGLVAALTKHATALQARHQLPVELHVGAEPEISLEAKEALYRIAQEALHNTVKHAQARSVCLRLERDATGLRLEVSDDGVGFDPTAAYPGHLGQHSMRERAERAGGVLSVASTPGKGTRITVRLP